MKHRLARGLTYLCPEFMRPGYKGEVLLTLANGETRDPGIGM